MKRFASSSQSRPVALWLFACAVLVFAMVVIGGITRLTGSGLSITEWKPIMGALPPMNAADWSEAFEKYKAIPQYAQVNAGMSMADFQSIFWWEWAHRLFGRLIGAAFALPFFPDERKRVRNRNVVCRYKPAVRAAGEPEQRLDVVIYSPARLGAVVADVRVSPAEVP